MHPKARGLDQRPLVEVADLLAEAQIEAAAMVRPAEEAIAAGAVRKADTIDQLAAAIDVPEATLAQGAQTLGRDSGSVGAPQVLQ